jgi:hypothetical protein
MVRSIALSLSLLYAGCGSATAVELKSCVEYLDLMADGSQPQMARLAKVNYDERCQQRANLVCPPLAGADGATSCSDEIVALLGLSYRLATRPLTLSKGSDSDDGKGGNTSRPRRLQLGGGIEAFRPFE